MLQRLRLWLRVRRRRPRVFVSYRREDASRQAGQLYRGLADHFGQDHVFMDREDIPRGTNFRDVIAERLGSSDAVVAVIGPHWLASVDGRRRLFEPEDFVRFELALAMSRHKRMLPVVLAGAAMPAKHEVPDVIAEIVLINAIEIRDTHFSLDLEELIESLRYPEIPPETIRGGIEYARRRLMVRRKARWRVGVVASLLIAMGWVSVLDLFQLDTWMDGVTMWTADSLAVAPPPPEVRIVAIDEKAEEALGAPFGVSWRPYHARLIERVSAAGARAIAFDLAFDSRSESSAVDTLLVAAAKAATKTRIVVGAASFEENAKNVPALLEHVQIAVLCVGERLHYAATAPLMVVLGPPPVSAALTDRAASSRYRFGLGMRTAFDTGTVKFDLLNLRLLAAATEIPLAARERVEVSTEDLCGGLHKGDEVATMLIKVSDLEAWRRPPQRIAYHEALVAPESSLREWFAEKYVVVGVTKKDKDVHRVRHGWHTRERHGVEVHADIVGNLVAGIYVRPAPWGLQLGATVGLTLFGAWLGLLYQARMWGRTLLIGSALAYFAVTIVVYRELHWLLNSVYHLLALVLAYWTLDALMRGRRRGAGDMTA